MHYQLSGLLELLEGDKAAIKKYSKHPHQTFLMELIFDPSNSLQANLSKIVIGYAQIIKSIDFLMETPS